MWKMSNFHVTTLATQHKPVYDKASIYYCQMLGKLHYFVVLKADNRVNFETKTTQNILTIL